MCRRLPQADEPARRSCGGAHPRFQHAALRSGAVAVRAGPARHGSRNRRIRTPRHRTVRHGARALPGRTLEDAKSLTIKEKP